MAVAIFPVVWLLGYGDILEARNMLPCIFLSCFLSSGVSSVFVHNYSDCVLGTEHCQNMGGLHSMPKCVLYVDTED